MQDSQIIEAPTLATSSLSTSSERPPPPPYVPPDSLSADGPVHEVKASASARLATPTPEFDASPAAAEVAKEAVAPTTTSSGLLDTLDDFLTDQRRWPLFVAGSTCP